MPVDREGGAGQRRSAERALVEARAGIAEPAPVAPEHLHVGEAMVAEGDGLGRLQVGEARHHRTGMLLRAGEQRVLQPGERLQRLVGGVAYP